jgi:hypothetical protein
MRPGIDYKGHGSAYLQVDGRLRAGYRNPFPGIVDFFERDHFTGVRDRPNHGLLKALGGRSLCWAGHSLRCGPQISRAGRFLTRRSRLITIVLNGSWASRAVKMDSENMADGVFQKTVPMRYPEILLKRGVQRLKAKGRTMDFVTQRKAIPTDHSWKWRATCHYCGHCMHGCEIDSKYTSANTPIPLAMRTGNLTLFTESTMTRIVADADGRHITRDRIYVNNHGETSSLQCKTLVLACSTIETARHLLINNLANSSGQIGKNLVSHFGMNVVAMFPELHTAMLRTMMARTISTAFSPTCTGISRIPNLT